MKVWIRTSAVADKIWYAQVLSGYMIEKDGVDSGYVKVENSHLEFADHENNRNFQKPGEKIFVGEDARQYEIKEMKKWLMAKMFDGVFNVSKSYFRAGRK